MNDFPVHFEVPAQFSYPQRKETLASFEDVLAEHAEQWNIRVTRSWFRGTGTHGTINVYLNDEVDADRREEIRARRHARAPRGQGLVRQRGCHRPRGERAHPGAGGRGHRGAS